MEIENLRTGIAEIVNDLNNLLNNTTDPKEQKAILRLLRKMNARHDAVVSERIRTNTDEYKKALAALRKAEAATKAAVKDIGKVAQAIDRVAKVAKAVDGVLKTVGSLAMV